MTEVKENSLIVELRTFAQLIGNEGRQAEFYNQMLKDAKPIGGFSKDEERPNERKMFSQGNEHSEEQVGYDSKTIGGFSDE